MESHSEQIPLAQIPTSPQGKAPVTPAIPVPAVTKVVADKPKPTIPADVTLPDIDAPTYTVVAYDANGAAPAVARHDRVRYTGRYANVNEAI